MVKRVIGSGVTDSNGQVSVGYVGKGTGQLNICAECMNLQETYEVCDAILYDKGLSGDGNHNDNCWMGLTGLSVTRGDDGTTVVNSSTTNKYLYASTSRTSPYRDFTQDFAFEFTFLGYTGTAILRVNNGTNVDKYFTTFALTDGDTLKVVVTTSKIYYYINGVEKTTIRTNYTEGASYVAFILNNGSLKFKNFKMYPI